MALVINDNQHTYIHHLMNCMHDTNNRTVTRLVLLVHFVLSNDAAYIHMMIIDMQQTDRSWPGLAFAFEHVVLLHTARLHILRYI